MVRVSNPLDRTKEKTWRECVHIFMKILFPYPYYITAFLAKQCHTTKIVTVRKFDDMSL